MGLLSGLGGLGLSGLENVDIFEEEEKEKEKEKEAVKTKAAAAPQIGEKDIVFDRNYKCPVCGLNFPSKAVRSGRSKLLGTDIDLRAKYDIIDPGKYDVVLCPKCGYAALTRFFDKITPAQVKLIQDKISSAVHVTEYNDPIYGYKEAMERYKLALVSAVVKKAKSSEKAYICLKSAWVARGYQESLQADGSADPKLMEELKKQEDEFLQNAYKGFVDAVQNESFPMCGMDEVTVDYLMAALAARCQNYDVASRQVTKVLTSPAANPRMKDKARDLKEQIVVELKKNK